MEEARALAEEAGMIGLKPVVISSEEIGQRPTEVLRNILVDLGLDPQVDFQQAAAFNERWQAGDYDMFLHGSVVDADPDDGHWNIFYSEGPWNTYGYKSDEADRLLDGDARDLRSGRARPALPGAANGARARRGRRLRLPRQGPRRLQRRTSRASSRSPSSATTSKSGSIGRDRYQP